MKKLLFLFAVLLGTVGAWAQTFTLQKSTNVDNPEYQYFIKNLNGVWMDANTGYIKDDTPKGKFAFFAYDTDGATENDVLIYSIDEQKWVSYGKAAGYTDQTDFAQLVDKQSEPNPWRVSMMTNGNTPIYQFAPHNNSGIANRYMNWKGGFNATHNSVGLYGTNASGDAGSAWVLWPATAQECYLYDVEHGTYLNLTDLGKDANQTTKDRLATVTTSPKSVYVQVDGDGKWQISTEANDGQYLNRSGQDVLSWDSWVSEYDSERSKWDVEDVSINNEKAIVLKNGDSGYLGNDGHSDGKELYINVNKDSQGVKFLILDSETEFANVIFKLNYKGVREWTEEYNMPIGRAFRSLVLPDYIYTNAEIPNGIVEESHNGKIYEINLYDILPFQTSKSYEDAVWYTMKIRGDKYVAKSSQTPYPNEQVVPAKDDANAMWAFMGNPYDGIKVLNKAAGASQTLGVDNGSNVIMMDGDNSWVIEQGNGGFILLQEQGTSKYVHDFDSKLKIWNDGRAKNDPGSAFAVSAVEAWGYPSNVTVGTKITDLSNIQDGQMVVFKVAGKNRYLTLTRELEAMIKPNAEGLSVFRLHRNGEEENKFTIESERDGYYFPNLNNTGWPNYYMTNEGTPNVFEFLTQPTSGSELTGGQFVIKSTTPWSGTTYGYFDSNDTDFTGWQGNGANAIYEIYNVTVSGEVTYEPRLAILTDLTTGIPHHYNYYAWPEEEPTLLEGRTSSGLTGLNVNNKRWSGNNFLADISYPFPVSTTGNDVPVYISSYRGSLEPGSLKYYVESESTQVKATKVAATETTLSQFMWAIYPSYQKDKVTFKIKHIAEDKYIMTTATGNTSAAEMVTLAGINDTPAEFMLVEGNRFRLPTDTELYLSLGSSGTETQNVGAWGWNGSNGGVHLGVSNDIYGNTTQDAELTDNAGNSHRIAISIINGKPSVAGLPSFSLRNLTLQDRIYTGTIDLKLPVSKTDASADRLLLMNPFSTSNSLKYYVDGENVRVSNNPTSEMAEYYQWAIYPYVVDNAFTFVLKNHGSRKYIKTNKTTSSENTTDLGAVTVDANIGDATHFTLEADNRFKIPGYDLRMSVTSSGESPQYVTVHTGHSGCNTYFKVVSDVVNNWKTDNSSKVGYVGFYPRNLSDEIAAIESYSDLLLFQESYVNDVIALKEGYYLIKGTGTGNNASWYATYGENRTHVMALAETPTVKHIWKLVGIPGEDGYKLMACNTGKYVQLAAAPSPSQINSDFDNGSKFGFTENAGAKFTIKDDNGHFLRTESDGTINYWDDNSGSEKNETWYLISATDMEIPVAISNAGAATLYSSVPLSIPEDVTAKYLKVAGNENSQGTLHYTTLKNTIPANTPVVLIGGEKQHTFKVAEDVAAVEGNILFGYSFDTAVEGSGHEATGQDGTIYALANKTNGLGFYHFNDNTYKAGKAYLDVSGLATSGVRFFNIFDEDNETGVEVIEIVNDNQKSEIYDLSGRRVQTAKKGLYIVNGKKVIR